MRIYADLGSHNPTGTLPGRIIKYDTTPEENATTTINGQYIYEVPEGASVVINSDSYLLPQDANSVPAQAAQEFLVRYPMYDHVLYNAFLENDDVNAMDLGLGAPHPDSGNTTPTLTGVGAPTFSRCKIGRPVGPGPVGMAPNRLEILPRSYRKPIDVYGSLVSKSVDITSFNPTNPGTDEVFVWWKLARLVTTHDVNSKYNGTNTPSLNEIQELSPEITNFSVWVSNDGGVSWYEANYLEPVDLVNPGTDIRIAFVNQGDDPVFLIGYCILFPDLP